MSERSGPRRPVTFKLDDPHVVILDPDEAAEPACARQHPHHAGSRARAGARIAAGVAGEASGSGAEGNSLGRAVLGVSGRAHRTRHHTRE